MHEESKAITTRIKNGKDRNLNKNNNTSNIKTRRCPPGVVDNVRRDLGHSVGDASRFVFRAPTTAKEPPHQNQ